MANYTTYVPNYGHKGSYTRKLYDKLNLPRRTIVTPDMFKEMLRLKNEERLTYKEIGKKFGINKVTVYKHMKVNGEVNKGTRGRPRADFPGQQSREFRDMPSIPSVLVKDISKKLQENKKTSERLDEIERKIKEHDGIANYFEKEKDILVGEIRTLTNNYNSLARRFKWSMYVAVSLGAALTVLGAVLELFRSGLIQEVLRLTGVL